MKLEAVCQQNACTADEPCQGEIMERIGAYRGEFVCQKCGAIYTVDEVRFLEGVKAIYEAHTFLSSIRHDCANDVAQRFFDFTNVDTQSLIDDLYRVYLETAMSATGDLGLAPN